MVTPRIVQDPVDQRVPATEEANFTCIGQGYGEVTISWFRGRQSRENPIQDKSFITNSVTSALITSILTIPNVLASDEGRYWCRLNNSAGSTDSSIAQLTIGGESMKYSLQKIVFSFLLFKTSCHELNSHNYLMSALFLYLLVDSPKVHAHPSDIVTYNGSSVNFTCEAFSYVPADFTWLHNGDVLDESPTILITTTNNTHTYTTTLTVQNVQLPDDGDYVCRAANREGGVLSNAATLIVIGESLYF